jgi:peptide/nickel transport system substrate-binding protein
MSRRGVLGGTAAVSAGVAGLALVGCGDDDDVAAPQATPTSSAPTPAAPGVASATATPAEKIPTGGTMRIGTFLDVLGIDPHIEVSIGLTQLARVYTYLGAFDRRDQKFHGMLAEKVEQPSPTEFIFTLRKDVKFQNLAPVNGRRVVAGDVKYSFERFRDLPQAQNNDFFKTIVDKMEVPDENTFKVTTKLPYAESLAELTGIQEAIVAKEDVDQRKDLQTGGVGAGPFMWDQYVKGEKVSLKRNPDYYDKARPYVDKWSWQTILDMNTLIQAYKADQHDICGALLTKLDFDDLQSNKNLVNYKIPALHYGSLGLNASVKPFNDPKVRQAIYLGMDRQQFIDKVFQGDAVPMGPLSAGLDFWALPQDQLKPYIGPDIKKAKELLSAAGYPNGFDMDIETSGALQIYLDHAQVAVSELKKIGINATLKLSDLTTYLTTHLFAGSFNATVFTHNPYESPKIPLGFYHKNGLGGGSWWHYDNPAVTAALDKQGQELDVQERKKQVLAIQKMLLDDGAPLLNFASPQLYNSYNKRVGGIDQTARTYGNFLYGEYLKPS